MVSSVQLWAQDFNYQNPIMSNSYTVPVSAVSGTTIAGESPTYTGSNAAYTPTTMDYSTQTAAEASGSATATVNGQTVTVYYEINKAILGWFIFDITYTYPDGTTKTERVYQGVEDAKTYAQQQAQAKAQELAEEYAQRVPLGSGVITMLIAAGVYTLLVYSMRTRSVRVSTRYSKRKQG